LCDLQHRDSQGNIRPERDNAEFRGTTVYASPFVHSGHDQCPRDDLFSVLHVFLDFVLGDLPWRAQAKSKDKAAVAVEKTKLLEDPDKFLEDLVLWQRDSDTLDTQVLSCACSCCTYSRARASQHPCYYLLRALSSNVY
jgi:hypothetical protein